jgi:DNA-binding CsgD family transcriptional regulator
MSTITRGHPLARLTPRQREILKAATVGGYADGGASLGIAPGTVRDQLARVYRRLGVVSLPQALYVLWLREDWGEAPEVRATHDRLIAGPVAP